MTDVVKRKGQTYKMVTEHALNRPNVSEAVFIEDVKFDNTTENFLGCTVYLQGAVPVAYYKAASNGGYIAVNGLLRNPPA